MRLNLEEILAQPKNLCRLQKLGHRSWVVVSAASCLLPPADLRMTPDLSCNHAAPIQALEKTPAAAP